MGGLSTLLCILLVCSFSFICAVIHTKEARPLVSGRPAPVRARKELVPPSFYFQKSWPNGQVIYKISPDFNESQQASILSAMEEISLKTCITFKERTSETDYLHIHMNNGIGCRTVVEHQQGESQSMTLDPSWCLAHGRIVHELMHSLGFTHEHQRPDRDKYIVIMWNNIKPEEKSQFNRKTYPLSETRGFDYDYTSILHYANWSEHAALDIKKPIILPRIYEPNMGQRIGLDAMDVEKLNLFYDCNLVEAN